MKKGAYRALDTVLVYYRYKWDVLRDPDVFSFEESQEFMSITSDDLIQVIYEIDRIMDGGHIEKIKDIALKMKKFGTRATGIGMGGEFIGEGDEISKKVEDFREEISSQI
ncbi:MAG: hypothetical protein PHS47_05495 [Methanocellales archaeon]|nr:hypothetical protein [Methanocellales archaeon]MDD3421734.1 hypothetical protein [Methanocellales archaeon]MDD4898755.1 hypothetical protein [Methanocellales archaeon]MDD5447504.1 hypothetical protein [Methanocellales archaeon]